MDKYLSGSPDPLTVDVFISNNNEDAFEAAFYLVMPKDLDYMKMEKIADTNDASITCTVPSDDNNYTLKCDIGNPLPANKVANFRVYMMPSVRRGMSPSYEFYMEANSTNPEKDGSTLDNIISKNISIWVETDLAIDGTSVPDFDLYKASDYKSLENATKEEDLGPQVVHLYNIFNNGPSDIVEAVVLIHYPYKTVSGDMLMYMTNQPETSGSILCDPHVAVNPLNLQLDQNLVRKSYLAERGAVVKTSWSHIEKSYTTAGGANAVTIGEGKMLSKEETIRLEKEDAQAELGDSSGIYAQRASAAANANAGGSIPGGKWHWEWNSTSTTSSDGGQGDRTYSYGGNEMRSSQLQSGQGGASKAGDNMNVQNQNMGAHNVREHVQMAGAPQGARVHYSSGQPQRTSYTYSSVGSTPLQQQQQQQRNNQQQYSVGSGAAYNEFGNNAGGDFGKVAAGGHGFSTNTMDLGTLHRGNVDDEIRSRGGPVQSNSYSYHHSSGQPVNEEIRTRGGPAQTSSYSYHHSSGTPQTHDNYQQSSHYSSGSSNFDNKNVYGPEYYDDFSDPVDMHHNPSAPHHRTRRDEPDQIDLNSPCRATKCETLRCVARNLSKGDGVWVAIRTRMVAKTMEKIAGSVPLNISTMAVSHVTKLPNIGTPTDEIIRTHEIYYKAIPEPTPVPDVVPLWVVVLAACAGALILLLLILLLYKVCIEYYFLQNGDVVLNNGFLFVCFRLASSNVTVLLITQWRDSHCEMDTMATNTCKDQFECLPACLPTTKNQH